MFAYCGNNPVNRSDPSGEFALSLVGGLLAVLGVTAGVFIIAVNTTTPAGQKANSEIRKFIYRAASGVAATGSEFAKSFAKDYNIGKSNSRAKEKTTTKTAPSSPTLIYRYGGTNPGNFVPSLKDVATNSGLSFSTLPPPPGVKASVTTIEALNATGLVRACQDRPGHVRVDPVVGSLADWHTGGSEHPCTIAVKSVVVKWYGGN